MATRTFGGQDGGVLHHDSLSFEVHARPVGFLQLPNELLDAVVAFLDRPSLCALALTCKATKLSASRALYATYTNRNAPSEAPFHLFLRTLCVSPELAAMVKELDIRGWRSDFEVATGLRWQGLTETAGDRAQPSRSGPVFVSTSSAAAPRAKPFTLFEEVAVQVGIIPDNAIVSVPRLKKTVVVGSTLKTDEDFLRLLRHGVEDAQIVLMLALLPNLTRLCIDGMTAYPILNWHYFLRNSHSALRALHALTIHGHSTGRGCELHSTTMGFLEFAPDLELVHLSGVSIQKDRQVLDLISNKKLRAFVAIECQVDLQVLRNMLCGQQLEEFRYKPAIGPSTEVVEGKFAEDPIVDSLEDSQQSLKRLALYSIQPSQAPRISHFQALEYLEMSFRHGLFDGTTELETDIIIRTLRKRIPRSLSTLALRYVSPTSEVPDTMEALADLKHQNAFPELKVIRLNFIQYSRDVWFPPVIYGDLGADAVTMFGKTLDQAGLRLECEQTD